MEKATINYIINTRDGSKILPLDQASLYYIDIYTSKYKDETDFIKNHPNRDKILNFIDSNNGKKGKLYLSYTVDLYKKRNIPLMYNNSDQIVLEDDSLNGKVSEIEKARRLLFNSKNQLFTRLLVRCSTFKETFEYHILISEEEYLFAKRNGIDVIKREDSYFIYFSELLKYRINNRKLGFLRELYEDMLEEWKYNMEDLNPDKLYYYSRQIRIMIDNYMKLSNKQISVKKLKMNLKNITSIAGRYIIKYNTVYRKRVINK